jgi:hypothetical protein
MHPVRRTQRPHHMDQSVTALWDTDLRLFRESYETRKYTVRETRLVFSLLS